MFIGMNFICQACGQEYKATGLDYRCKCGGLFKLLDHSLQMKTDLSLGEIITPVLKQNLADRPVYFKLDYYQPSGSFKDRGARLMVGYLAEAGVNKIIEDSSGNAGAAVAAYAAAANIDCEIYLPADTSRGKLAQVLAYGARINKVPGDRDETAQAIKAAAAATYYASHVYNPLFFAGVASLAQELKEELGYIERIILPVGNGSLLLGIWQGFKELLSPTRRPQLIAVQAEPFLPVYLSWQQEKAGKNSEDFISSCDHELKGRENLAEGIAISKPDRLPEILAAVRESRGEVIKVSQAEIRKTLAELWQKGIYVEPTSAVAPAGAKNYLTQVQGSGTTVIPLTGSGLKYNK